MNLSRLIFPLLRVQVLSGRAMLLHILILLLVTMSAAQGNGQQDNSSQSKQLPKKHLRFVTGNWIEEMENEVKNSTEKMLKV